MKKYKMPQRTKKQRKEYQREYRMKNKEPEEQQGPSEQEQFIKKWKPMLREKVRK